MAADTRANTKARLDRRIHERRAIRQNRAAVVADWLLAAGLIQKSQTKPAAPPDSRILGTLTAQFFAGRDHCFRPIAAVGASPAIRFRVAHVNRS